MKKSRHLRSLSRPRRAWGLALTVGLLMVACTAPTGSPEEDAPTQNDTGTPGDNSTQAHNPSPTEEPSTEEPPPPLAWGPTEAELEAATESAATLSDEELAGLVIVARYEGTSPEVPAQLMRDLHLGGIILFAQNVEGLEQVQETATAAQEAQRELEREWPAIIAVDNEGGIVQRLSGERGPWTTFPAFAAAEEAAPGVVRAAMAAMGRELRASGVNTNYAPVADVTGAGDVTIKTRSASSDPKKAALAVAEAVAGFADAGVLSSVKHFPGHGSLGTDSHVGLPVQNAPIAQVVAHDLPPFRAGIEAGTPMVMVGHIAVTAWDEGVPASLSDVAYSYLREELGFTGVTITDGLDMGALPWDSGEIAVRAMVAGADILLTPASAQGARDGLLAALADGSLSRERLVEAAGRIIAMMEYQQVLERESGPVSDLDVGSSQVEADALRR